MDKLTAMQTYVAVVQQGGFSGAARVLGVPKTRVSQRIQDLEAALGVRLLHRTTRVVTPTAEGVAYFERCQSLIEEINDMEAEMLKSGEEPVGRLHVTIMSALAHALILPHLPSFLADNPQVTLKLQVTDRLMNLPEEGIDCAIRGGRLDSSSMISRRIASVAFGCFASPDYLANSSPVTAPEDLLRSDRIVASNQRAGSSTGWSMSCEGRSVRIDTAPRLETDDDQSALTACLAGIGITSCPAFIAAKHVADGRLVRVLPNWSTGTRPIYLVYPTKKHPSAKLRNFLDWTAGLIRTHA